MPNDNLVVIAAMARKGGSGKTTLSRALISAAVAAKRRALLIDTDSTRVLGTWHKRADANGLGSSLLRSATAESVTAVDRTIGQVYEEDLADFIFIDTAGVGAEWSDGIAVLADQFDIGDTARQLRARRLRVATPGFQLLDAHTDA